MSGDEPTLDEAISALDGSGTVAVNEAGGRTEVEVIESDKLGVRIREVQVGRSVRDVAVEAEALPNRLRAIPDRVVPIEVDPGLGGAILRTRPENMRRGRFFEVEVRPEQTGIKRYVVVDGERTQEDFTLTREQLRDLVDEFRDE
jgi:hypothetical protein